MQTRNVLITNVISLKHGKIYVVCVCHFLGVVILCCQGQVDTMKRTGEKKRFGKGFMSSHEFPNEQTKESYLIEIGELTKRLERYYNYYNRFTTLCRGLPR